MSVLAEPMTVKNTHPQFLISHWQIAQYVIRFNTGSENSITFEKILNALITILIN